MMDDNPNLNMEPRMTDYSTVETLADLNVEFERIKEGAASRPALAVYEARALVGAIARQAVALLGDEARRYEDADLAELMDVARHTVLPAFEDAEYTSRIEGLKAIRRGIFGGWVDAQARIVLTDFDEAVSDDDGEREFAITRAKYIVDFARHWSGLVLGEVLDRADPSVL